MPANSDLAVEHARAITVPTRPAGNSQIRSDVGGARGCLRVNSDPGRQLAAGLNAGLAQGAAAGSSMLVFAAPPRRYRLSNLPSARRSLPASFAACVTLPFAR